MPELYHEPQTKGTNKTRELQDAIIRARRAGCDDPLSVAEYIYGWFADASRDIQVSVLHYAVQHLWNNVDNKIKPRQHRASSSAAKARIEADERAKLNRQWLDAIIPMTGAQVRAAKRLPDSMAAMIGDDQRVGDVFTVAELLTAIDA